MSGSVFADRLTFNWDCYIDYQILVIKTLCAD